MNRHKVGNVFCQGWSQFYPEQVAAQYGRMPGRWEQQDISTLQPQGLTPAFWPPQCHLP